MNNQEIHPLSTGEHMQISDIIADSFRDDPVNMWVFGSPSALKSFYAIEAKELYLRHGFGHRLSDGSGVTLWLPPGIPDNLNLIGTLKEGWSMITQAGPGSIIRGLKANSGIDAQKPKQPYYYLDVIAVRHAHQGKGLGRRLMEEGLKQVDAARMPAYLESSKEVNIPFYCSFGFEVVEKFHPTKGCPPMWSMWREECS